MRKVMLMGLSFGLLAAVASAQPQQATTVAPAAPVLAMPAQTRPVAARGQQAATPRPAQPTTPRPAAPVGTTPVTSVQGQTPQAAQAPRAEIVPTQNVRVELTITDSAGGQTAGPPAKKTVSMLIADGLNGRIRSSNYVMIPNTSPQAISINVDTTAKVRAEGRIQLSLTFEYQPEVSMPEPGQPRTSARASISESMSVLVLDGKPTLISQSADPASDRRVNIEVTATVVK